MTNDEARAELERITAMQGRCTESYFDMEAKNLLALAQHFAAEAARNEVDALRYRWLQSNRRCDNEVRSVIEAAGPIPLLLYGEALDAAIDAAIKEEGT